MSCRVPTGHFICHSDAMWPGFPTEVSLLLMSEVTRNISWFCKATEHRKALVLSPSTSFLFKTSVSQPVSLLETSTTASMSLSRHIDPETIIEKLRNSDDKAHKHHAHTRNAISSLTPYSSRYNAQSELSKFIIPQEGAPVPWSSLLFVLC